MPSVALDRDVIRPAFLSVPPTAVGSLGDEAAELAIALDQQVDEEERIALRALMPIQVNGMPAGLEGAIVCGRRQVKSWALEQAVVHDSFVTRVHRVVWTAHLTETSDDNFEHLCGLLESYDWLRKRVRRIYRGNGDHRIMLTNGGRIEFGARESGTTGRGRDVNRLILDEWLFGTAGMLGAMVPMLGGVKDRYIRYGSSPGLVRSEALRSLRDRGRRGNDPSLSWCEWTSERMRDGKRVLPQCADPDCLHMAGIARGCFLDDEGIRRQVNPAYGRRLAREFVDQERLAMPPAEYARERCGIWEDPPDVDAADDVLANWGECADGDASPPTDPLVLAVDVSHDSKSTAIVACGGHESMPCIEVVDYRPKRGVGWAPNRLAELVAKHNPAAVAVCAGGPAMAMVKRRKESPTGWVIEAKVDGNPVTIDVTVVGAVEQASASQAFAQDVTGAKLRHRGEQAMAISVRDAVRKFSGDGWRWSRKDSRSDISPLVAGVAARHVWLARPAPPPTTKELMHSFG